MWLPMKVRFACNIESNQQSPDSHDAPLTYESLTVVIVVSS